MQTDGDIDIPAEAPVGADQTVAGLAPQPNPDLAPTDWMTADEIRRRSFSTVERGYAPGEVREYLARLAEWFADLNVQLSRLRKAGDEAPPATAPSSAEVPSHGEAQELAARMAEILRDAEQHASKLRDDAEERAASTLSDAEHRSTAMVSNAEQRSAAMVAEAKARSTAMLSDAELTSNQLRDESGGWAERARAEAEELLITAHETRATLLAELTSVRAALEGAHARLEAVPVRVSGEPVVDDPSAAVTDLAAEVEQPLAFPNGDTPRLDRE